MTKTHSVRMTRGAQSDLADIAAHLEREASPAIARGFLDDVLELVASLETFPARGSVPPELQAVGIQEFRQLIMRPYRIVYRVEGGTVFIMLVADGRRDMQALLERRLFRE